MNSGNNSINNKVYKESKSHAKMPMTTNNTRWLPHHFFLHQNPFSSEESPFPPLPAMILGGVQWVLAMPLPDTANINPVQAKTRTTYTELKDFLMIDH